MRYPARFEPAEEGGFVVTFRDIPEAITQGDNEEEALAMAQDALLTALEFYFEDRRTVPLPSDLIGEERFVELPPAYCQARSLTIPIERNAGLANR